MGVMLREGLRRLCADGGWSYAVLWRPAEAAGVRHLVWDEGHCEVTRRSTVSCSNQVKFQDDGGVGDAFEKMKSEVHVVGYGLIGCAALTGNHRWINCNLLGGESVGFVEINSQLYSGIQTVAIIPVLPQGVVQLGSIHMIMEDIRFVDRVRSLVLQLGSLAGELIFDNTVSGSLQNDHTSMEQLLGEGASHGSTGASILTCTSQPSSSSVSEISQSRMLSHGKTPLRSNTTITTALNPIVEFQQLKVLPSFFPLISSSGQQQIQFNENCVVSSDLCMPSKRQSVQPDVTSDDKFMLPSDGSGFSYGFSFLEQLSSSVSDGPITSRANLAQSVPMHLDSHKCAAVSYSQGSIMMPPVSTWELHGSACDPGRHVLDTASQQTKAVDLKDPNIFSRRSYDANYVAYTNTMAENPSSQATSSIDFCTTVDVLRDRKLQDVAVKIACSSSQVQLSTTCSQGFSMDGSNLNFVIREQLGGSSSQNIPCFSADQRQCTHSAPSVSVMAESSPEMLNIRTSGNDLLDVLGLYDRPAVSDSSLDCIFSNVQSVNAWESCPHVSGCMSQLDASTPFDVSVCETSSQTFTESRQDQLLDAVVSKVNMGVQDTSVDVACRTAQSRVVDYSVHLSTSKYGKLTLPGQCQSEMYAISPSLLETGVPCSSVKSSCSMAGMGDYYSGEGHKTHVNLWTDSDQIAKSDDGSFAQFKKAEEMGKLNRKRSKPGESPRPRPKDRQMIQDRVKELREIVPNGAKLSIDALLERTIKHMLFLQSVTKHADKLKELGEPKIINKEGGLLLKDNFEGGATWAFEVGSQTMICPIIVEDLNPPRQLLVEMLCEERGFFLEIADLIRGLGLTILKGVMEARSDKVWARFAVEANRDVTRMDIFLSLVQLLEPRAAADAHQQGFESTNLATNTSSSQVPPGASKPL